MKIKMLLTVAALVIAVSVTPKQADADTAGCLLGAAGGGFGGAQFGKGSSKLALTALGTLLGCGIGSSVQDRYQQPQYSYQQPYQQPQYSYQQPQYRSRYNDWPRPRQTQVYSRYNDYRQQSQLRARHQQHVAQPVRRACPYSREYQSTVTVSGREVRAYGQACSWDGGQNWDLGPLTPAQ